jgi:hypothetical protein
MLSNRSPVPGQQRQKGVQARGRVMAGSDLGLMEQPRRRPAAFGRRHSRARSRCLGRVVQRPAIAWGSVVLIVDSA